MQTACSSRSGPVRSLYPDRLNLIFGSKAARLERRISFTSEEEEEEEGLSHRAGGGSRGGGGRAACS